MKFSACIEWLFADEAAALPDRIRLAKAAGLDAVEFWWWSNKDMDAVAAALAETGMRLTGFVAEPMIALTDAGNKTAFLEGLKQSADLAQKLGATTLIAQAGNDLPGVSRSDQRAALVDCLKAASVVLEGTGVRLGLEPLNTLIDHEGYFLSSTVDALDIVADVGSPRIGIVYDLYHSAVMGERIEDVLAGRTQAVLHVHVADHPGRGDPGTGGIDLRERLAWLFSNGYDGYVGLEYRPSRATSTSMKASLDRLRP